ncbi:MAG: type IV pilus assembly protein PilM [Candidatus Buchananbacteria bacterium]|nr:type IV pilus assembly protein PilM [Candidatus Buchananbacteria bacterium]
MAKQKIFGLDISDHSIEATLLEKSMGKTKVVSYSRVVLRQEIVKNGVIKKPSLLTDKIKQLLATAKPKAIRVPFCIVSIPDSQVFTNIFKFPAGLKHEEIRKTIPFKAEEVIPFRSSEIYFDFKTINVSNGTQEVFYAAVPTKVVDSYVEVLSAAGLIPVAFDLESLSLARCLLVPKEDVRKQTKKTPAQAVLIIDIGSRTSDFNVVDIDGVRLNSVLKIAGNRFTKVLTAGLKITGKEADDLKMKVGFKADGGNAQALKLLQTEAQKIIKEAKKIIDYYQETGSQIGGVLLAGGSSLLPEIEKFFADQLGLPVAKGDALRKVADPAKLLPFKSKAIIFANVIGLALRGLKKKPENYDINLLPAKQRKFSLKPDKRDKKAWRAVYIRVAILLILCLALLGLINLQQRGFDIYKQAVNQPDYVTNSTDQNLDIQALDALRQPDQTIGSTTTPTTADSQDSTEPPALIDLEIQQTSIGFLNVREGPAVSFAKVGEASSGDIYQLIDEQNGWYKIEFIPGEFGWVSGQYVDKLP